MFVVKRNEPFCLVLVVSKLKILKSEESTKSLGKVSSICIFLTSAQTFNSEGSSCRVFAIVWIPPAPRDCLADDQVLRCVGTEQLDGRPYRREKLSEYLSGALYMPTLVS